MRVRVLLDLCSDGSGSPPEIQEENMGSPPTPTRYYTRQQAAGLCDTSLDTIKRRHKAGAFPNARQRPGDPQGTWEIPVTDLVDAGLYELPAGGLEQAEAGLAERREVRKLAELQLELTREQAEKAAQAKLLDELRARVRFAEKQVERLSAALGGGR